MGRVACLFYRVAAVSFSVSFFLLFLLFLSFFFLSVPSAAQTLMSSLV